MKVYFLRHGEGVDDVEDRFGGWGDLSLSDKGKKQEREKIPDIQKLNIDCIFSSPLKRAFETAEIVGEGINIPVKKWLYLKERNTYGLMCGEKNEDIKNDYPELLKQYEEGIFVLGSERYEDLIKRLEMMISKFQIMKEKNILAVTHGKFLEAFCKDFLKKEIAEKEDCCILEVEIDSKGVSFVHAQGITFKSMD
jgi:broad specificity phosphatase PhoE